MMTLPADLDIIIAPNPSLFTLQGTNSYLLGDGELVVIDPGPDSESHLTAIERAAARRGRITAILVTHGHPDHIEGATKLQARTGAPIAAWTFNGGVTAEVASMPLDDNQRLDTSAGPLRVIYAPGHKADHVVFLLEERHILFAGDVLAGQGTVVIAPPDGNMADYLSTLRRLLKLHLRLILPGHGPRIEQPAKKLGEYIAHRLEREQQVLSAIQAGSVRVPDMVRRIYSDVDARLHLAAAASLTAHLLMLEKEGRVQRLEEDGHAVYRIAMPGV